MKLHLFQNASIEVKKISFVYKQNRFTVKKLICKLQNENNFTDKRFLLTLKRNPSTIKGLHLEDSVTSFFIASDNRSIINLFIFYAYNPRRVISPTIFD